VDFLADDFAAADFEFPFVLFEPELDLELLRLLAGFFCCVWAILTLLSVESFRRAAYPRRKPSNPPVTAASTIRLTRRAAGPCRQGPRSRDQLKPQRLPRGVGQD
jgi:hypothetical protein